jgi:hypothetical protein
VIRRLAGSSKQLVAVAAVVSSVAWPFSALAQPTIAQARIPTDATDGESAAMAVRKQSGSESVYIRVWRPEIFFGWASAWLGPSRIGLGPAWSNLNAGIGLRLNRWLGVELEVGRSLDEALREVPPPVSSSAGAAQLRQGVTSATFASSKALVIFRQRAYSRISASASAWSGSKA